MEDFDQAIGPLGDDRRVFLKKLAVGTAFAVPVVSSFTMSGVQAAYAQTASTSANVSNANANRTTTTTSPNTTPSSTTSTTTTSSPNQTS